MLTSNPSENSASPNPPVSERKAAANRANAQRSTGPRTPQGKTRSSLNALRHGILARAAFNPTIDGKERRAEFEEIVAGLAQEFQPATASEHMMVQQLAGCYWKLAKVWNFETEAAWRSSVVNNLGFGELGALETAGLDDDLDKVLEDQAKVFPKAGLGNVTIPTGPSVATILRYQGAINSMLFRCLNFLERRRKERMNSDEACEELDYINEATAAAASEPEQLTAAEEHKRTQINEADAVVSSEQNQESENETSEIEPAPVSQREETA